MFYRCHCLRGTARFRPHKPVFERVNQGALWVFCVILMVLARDEWMYFLLVPCGGGAVCFDDRAGLQG